MFQLYTCKTCNSIISTSHNANFFISRFDSCDIDLPCMKDSSEIVLFILDNEEYSQMRDDSSNFEYVITVKDIKCKQCNSIIGVLHKDQTEMELIIGNLFKENIYCFEIANEYPNDVKLYTQFESDTLTSMKEIKTLTDTLNEYSTLILNEDVVKMKMELNDIENMINQSGIDKLNSLTYNESK